MTPPGPSLRDIHLPPPPGWWPPAPGWWVLACIAVALLAAGVVLVRRRRRWRQRWQIIERELQQLDGAPSGQVAARLSELMRRVARLHDSNALTAQGDAWNVLVDRYAADERQRQLLGDLSSAIYRPGAELDSRSTVEAARRWLRRAAAGSSRHD